MQLEKPHCGKPFGTNLLSSATNQKVKEKVQGELERALRNYPSTAIRGLKSRMEMREGKSVNLKTHQQKLPNSSRKIIVKK